MPDTTTLLDSSFVLKIWIECADVGHAKLSHAKKLKILLKETGQSSQQSYSRAMKVKTLK